MRTAIGSATLLLALLSPLAPPAGASSWTRQTVVPFAAYFDLAVTPNGIPHVLYNDCTHRETCTADGTGGTLTHAVLSGGEWVKEPMAGNVAGDLPSLALDDQGRPHAAWLELGWQMHYGYWDQGWQVEDLVHELPVGYRSTPTLVLDDLGEPHVAIIERETVRYAYRELGTWTDERVGWSSLDNWSARAIPAFDSGGDLVVGTWEYYVSAAVHTRSGASWSTEYVGGEAGWWPWMELDPLDARHMTYHGNGIHYATDRSGTWVEETIDSAALNNFDQFVLGPTGQPLVVYARATLVSVSPILYDVELVLATRGSSGAWAYEVIDGASAHPDPWWSSALALDDFGQLHVLYQNAADELIYARRSVATPVEGPRSALGSRVEAVVPNPANPRAEIRYRVGRAGPVELTVYDLAGRRVRTLVEDHRSSGSHVGVWDGRSDAGGVVSSGTYLVRLRAVDREDVARVLLLK